MVDDDIDTSLADREDAVPIEMLDEIVAEYQRNIIFDGVALIVGVAGG